MTSHDQLGGERGLQPGDQYSVPTALLEAPDVWNQEALRLTPAEIAELIETNGASVDVAPMHQFDTFEEFMEHQNNFWASFGAGGMMGEINAQKKYYQRFAILNPDSYIRLARGHRDIYARMVGGEETFDDPWWVEMYEAYKKVSQLVDMSDEYVIRDGEVDAYKLIR